MSTNVSRWAKMSVNAHAIEASLLIVQAETETQRRPSAYQGSLRESVAYGKPEIGSTRLSLGA